MSTEYSALVFDIEKGIKLANLPGMLCIEEPFIRLPDNDLLYHTNEGNFYKINNDKLSSINITNYFGQSVKLLNDSYIKIDNQIIDRKNQKVIFMENDNVEWHGNNIIQNNDNMIKVYPFESIERLKKRLVKQVQHRELTNKEIVQYEN